VKKSQSKFHPSTLPNAILGAVVMMGKRGT